MDLTDADSIGRLAHAVSERWGALDMLVLNAAMLGTLTPLHHADPKEFASVFTLNVSAQQALLAAFDPLLRKANAARVIGVTSSVGRTPRAFWGVYGASKAAFEIMLESYGLENINNSGIKTAIVDPGATRTKMRAKAYPGEDASALPPPETVASRIAALMVNSFPGGLRDRVN